MDTSPVVTAEIMTTISHDPPPAQPSETVTIKLEDEQEELDLYERCKIHNQKRAFRRQRTAEYSNECHADSFDYSNSILYKVINIGRDARSVIISKRQEREETEAYCPSTNYRSRSPPKRQHISSDRPSTSRNQHHERVATRQEMFN